MNTQSRAKVTSIGRTQQAPTARGKIKWYSSEKRYGFLVDGQGVEHYLNSSYALAVDNPHAGQAVDIISCVNHKGPRATLIREVVEQTSTASPISGRQDSRVQCGSCAKLMVPKLILGPPLAAGSRWTPVPKKSVCPFCGSTHQEFAPSQQEKNRQWLQAAFVIFVLVIVVASLR